MFTQNNPEGLLGESDFRAIGARYLVFQEEVGDLGTHHLQGYVEMRQPVRFSHFREVIPGAHWEPAKGTSDECEEYCTKEETRVGGPYRWGSRGGQGKRNDLITLREAIKEGKRGRELFDDDSCLGPAVRYSRGVEKLVEAYDPPVRRDAILVTFHYGPAGKYPSPWGSPAISSLRLLTFFFFFAGSGKTHCCHSDDAYYFDGNNGFWEGYAGQSKVILDEFSGHVLTPLMFQRLCDKYPLMLNVKGGSMPCKVTEVHICSNYLPSQWWGEKTRYNQQAVYRRINVVHWHYDFKKLRVYLSDDSGYAMDKLVNKLYTP